MSIQVKASIRLKYKAPDFAEVTFASGQGVTPARLGTGWFAVPKDFPELSVDIPSSQALLTIMESNKAPKGLTGLYVNFDRVEGRKGETNPIQVTLSFYTGKPGLDSTTATFQTQRENVDGPFEKCPKLTALGWAMWN